MSLPITPLGDQALIIELADRIELNSVQRIHRICDELSALPLPGVSEVVPAATTITLFYSATEVGAAGAPAGDIAGWLAGQVRERLAMLVDSKELPAPRLVEVPVCYGGEFGPDLEAVAARVKLSTAEVIARHCAVDHFVLQLGFAPGFPYLHGLPKSLAMPRRDTPRVAVPAGSVGIANSQSCIYPVVIPGGWNLIGRTPIKLFLPGQKPPTLLQPGD